MLDQEIAQGLLEVETEHSKIIIRIQEKGSFSSGQATLNPAFFEVISKITDVIAKTPGKIIVAGHTDNIPISTQRFRSNWELSSARAVTVVHAMLTNPLMKPERILVEGHADSNPIVPNDSWAETGQESPGGIDHRTGRRLRFGRSAQCCRIIPA